jgi:hypothetical protein
VKQPKASRAPYLFKGIEVADDEINGLNGVLGELLHVGGIRTVCQQSAVDRRVKRLHAAACREGKAESQKEKESGERVCVKGKSVKTLRKLLREN